MIAKSLEAVEASPVDYDTIIIGAGISGINAAYRHQQEFPDRSYAILENRSAIGGTWDLFKYPGIRSDSDLHTFGFSWRPWTNKNTIADAHLILNYMNECADAEGISKNILFRHNVESGNWSTAAQAWSFRVQAEGVPKTITARWLVLATGYYDYKEALPAKINGIDKFAGQVIHPQFWPEDLDYTGKNIVVIGSGATAITLIPNLVNKASHVTMLQRSPGYILSAPREDVVAGWLKALLPVSWAYTLIRLKWLLVPFLFFKFCRAYPGAGRWILQRRAKRQLPDNVPLDPHFNPSYGPWEQRLCVCPSGDFYEALRDGKASVVTGHIDRVTKDSIYIKDQDVVLKPDIIVTATGLKVQLAGGAKLTVDGEKVEFKNHHVWRGMLMNDVPNATLMVGYTNASWTLGADASMQLFNRIRKYMVQNGKTSVVAEIDPALNLQKRNLLNLNSTYVVKAEGALPMGGDKAPWLPRQSYMTDIYEAKYGSITDGLKYM